MSLASRSLLLLALSFPLACETESSPSAPTKAASPPAPSKKAELPEFPEKLWEARAGFETVLVYAGPDDGPVEEPPKGAPLSLIRYPSEVGELAAYVSKDPKDGKKHPAIVWITGGDTNSIGNMWTPMPPFNDQTAAQYRQAGIVMMYPSQRGGNDNPGRAESFLGEVDDVIAATKHLRTLPYVDPDRIYLGGHSTGGTLALLIAETTDVYRAVFSFGPVTQPSDYGGDYVTYDTQSIREEWIRSPVRWLDSIRSPTFVIEGQDGNWIPLHALKGANKNPLVSFIPIRNTDHFGVLAPVNAVIAQQIVEDTGPRPKFDLKPEALEALFER